MLLKTGINYKQHVTKKRMLAYKELIYMTVTTTDITNSIDTSSV